MKKSNPSWTNEDLKTLRRLYPKTSTRAIAVKLNKTYDAIKSKATVLKLKKIVHASPNRLTSKEVAFIKKNYLKYPNHVLAEMMGRSESAIQRVRKDLGIYGKINTGCFKKGMIPANKGKKMPPDWSTEKMKGTQFKKGNTPKNVKTDGHVSIRHNYKRNQSYMWIRIRRRYWRELHRVMWEKTMGPIPKGYNVQFKDKNSLNCEPSNLYLINRENQMLQNTIHRYDPEIKSLIRLAGKLKRKIKSYEEQD